MANVLYLNLSRKLGKLLGFPVYITQTEPTTLHINPVFGLPASDPTFPLWAHVWASDPANFRVWLRVTEGKLDYTPADHYPAILSHALINLTRAANGGVL